ncbi:flavin reductase family protein [Paenibacillus cymbidii]|uniref:flavin reductase family protein n=1 Tax=Paenibacillus cymbidii TaxID=1639034 RepID=UPI001080DC48|nr:flavin reductase family protein [Paenibacillus cymbidii]
MIAIDPKMQADRDNYKLLIGSVVPRPIALVTTLSADGVLNAAPFSFFSVVASAPPLLSVSVQRTAGGRRKDTARNALARRELVIHVVDESNVAAANRTAAGLPPDESEVAFAGLTPVAGMAVGVPGIREAKIRMECVLEHAFELGGSGNGASCDLLIARVVLFHVDEALLDRGRIDERMLAPVSRLAGDNYATLGNVFAMERP